jgi:hypothetical protein
MSYDDCWIWIPEEFLIAGSLCVRVDAMGIRKQRCFGEFRSLI